MSRFLGHTESAKLRSYTTRPNSISKRLVFVFRLLLALAFLTSFFFQHLDRQVANQHHQRQQQYLLSQQQQQQQLMDRFGRVFNQHNIQQANTRDVMNGPNSNNNNKVWFLGNFSNQPVVPMNHVSSNDSTTNQHNVNLLFGKAPV
jgi:hypothetical protein